MARTAIRGNINVLEATKKRISFLFDSYENISLSFSGGKDSTALFHLINNEASKRDRKFILYFQDQEAEYQGTVECLVAGIIRCIKCYLLLEKSSKKHFSNEI